MNSRAGTQSFRGATVFSPELLNQDSGRLAVRRGEQVLRDLRLNLPQPPLEKSAFAVIRDQSEGSQIALRRFDWGAKTPQQIGARGMQQVIVGQIVVFGQRVDQRESRLRTVYHRHGYGAVQ